MDVRVELWRKLSAKELMLLNCGVGENSWESLGLQGDPISQSWVFFGRNDAKAETPVLWPPHAKSWLIGKDPVAGRDWGKEEKGTTGWDGWMASPTWQTWVWVNSRSWWWTGRPGMLWFMELQRVGHNWVAELNWTERSRKMDKLSSHWSKPKELMGHLYCANPGKWGMLWWTFPHEGPHLLGILNSSTSGNLY